MFPPDYFAFIWFQGLGIIRDDVSCDWKGMYLTKNEKIVVPNLRVDIFSFRVFNALLQSYSHRAYSKDQSYQRVELNNIYTDYHCRILQQTAYKEINVDKMLRYIPLFTVFPSRGLAREFTDVSRNKISLTLFGASSPDYHPCFKVDDYLIG